MFSFLGENIKKLSDADLLARYLEKGKNKYAEELYKRLFHIVYGIGLKYLKNSNEAEDAVMAVMESFLKESKLKPINNLGGWLHNTTRNYCLNLLRGKERVARRENAFANELYSELEVLFDEGLEIQLAKLPLVIAKLPEGQKLCVNLFYLENKSYKEIVELTGLSEMQVKSNIQNGKRNLRISLTQ